MSTKTLYIGIAVIIVGVAIAYLTITPRLATSPNVPNVTESITVEEETPVIGPEGEGHEETKEDTVVVDQAQYTADDVAANSDATSCWTIVRGIVYDLTPFIDEHPGGANNILRLCGTDGTDAFEGKHGGEPRPENTLEGYEIGTLAP